MNNIQLGNPMKEKQRYNRKRIYIDKFTRIMPKCINVYEHMLSCMTRGIKITTKKPPDHIHQKAKIRKLGHAMCYQQCG